MLHPSPSQVALLQPDAAHLAVTLSKARTREREAIAALDAARHELREAKKMCEHVIEQIALVGAHETQMMLDLEPGEAQGRARCAGCRNRLSLRQGTHSRDPRAWAEVPKPDGKGTLYYCRGCSEQLYKSGSA